MNMKLFSYGSKEAGAAVLVVSIYTYRYTHDRFLFTKQLFMCLHCGKS